MVVGFHRRVTRNRFDLEINVTSRHCPFLCFPCGSGKGEEPSGGNVLRLIQIRLAVSSLEKITSSCQRQKSRQSRTADSSLIDAVSFSSARTTKRFPSPRRASAIQIPCPQEPTAQTQPQLQPASPSLSAMI